MENRQVCSCNKAQSLYLKVKVGKNKNIQEEIAHIQGEKTL